MKLSECKESVNALKSILEDYDYLEYDEKGSITDNTLRVRVRLLDAKRDFSVARTIVKKLEISTGRCFYLPNPVTPGGSTDRDKEWTFFIIRERISS